MDTGGYEAFFRDVYPGLLRFAKRRVDPDSAEDVCAQTMATIWLKNPAPTPRIDLQRKQLRGLAYTVLYGHIRNALRADVRLARLIAVLTVSARNKSELAGDIDSGGKCVEGLSELSSADRQVLLLSVDGFRVAEIALKLGCTPAAISMRLMRAKRNLKHILATSPIARS